MIPQEYQPLSTHDNADYSDRDKWNHVKNLDDFFRNMYIYYTCNGLPSIILSQLTSLISLAFTIGLSTFLIAFVDWHALANCHDDTSCDKVIHEFRLTPSMFSVGVAVYFILLIVLWLYRCVESIKKIGEAIEMEKIYRETFGVKPKDFRDLKWYQIVQKLIDLHEHGTFRVTVKDKLTVHDVALRIMRKENYLIGLINKNCLDLTVPWWISPIMSDRLFLTKSLEWALTFCITDCMFDDQLDLSQDFLRDVDGLKWKFQTVGLIHFILLPFMLIFMASEFFLENAQQFHSTKSYLGPRQWSPLALWQFREFNELPHIFEERITKSNIPANDYLNSFMNPYQTILAKSIAFISGALLASLLLISLVSDGALLYISVGDHNLLWYLAIITATYTGARSLVPAETKDYEEGDEQLLAKTCAHTHHFPLHWQSNSKSLQVRDEVAELFQTKAQIFIMELLSVVLTPAVLCFSLPPSASIIVNFIANHTATVEGIGAVCDYSLFNFERYGDENFCAPLTGYQDEKEKAENGKLEKSFMNFQNAHPNFQAGDISANPSMSYSANGPNASAGASIYGLLSTFRDMKHRQQERQLASSILITRLNGAQTTTPGVLNGSTAVPALTSHYALHNGPLRGSRIGRSSFNDDDDYCKGIGGGVAPGLGGISLDVINSMHESAQSNTVKSENASPTTPGSHSPIVQRDNDATAIVTGLRDKGMLLGTSSTSEDAPTTLSESNASLTGGMPFALNPLSSTKQTSFESQHIRQFPTMSDNASGLSLINPTIGNNEKSSLMVGNFPAHNAVLPRQRAHQSGNNLFGGNYRSAYPGTPSSVISAQQQHRRPPMSPTPRIEMSYLNSQHNSIGGGYSINSPSNMGGRPYSYGSQNLLNSNVGGAATNKSRFMQEGGGIRAAGSPSSRFISSNSDVNLSSAMISMMKGENMEDYKNDFYWLAQYQRERTKNPKAFEQSLHQSQQGVEGVYFTGEAGENSGGGGGAFSMSSSASFPFMEQTQQQDSFWNDNPLTLSGAGGFLLHDLHGDRTAGGFIQGNREREYIAEQQQPLPQYSYQQHQQSSVSCTDAGGSSSGGVADRVVGLLNESATDVHDAEDTTAEV